MQQALDLIFITVDLKQNFNKIDLPKFPPFIYFKPRFGKPGCINLGLTNMFTFLTEHVKGKIMARKFKHIQFLYVHYVVCTVVINKINIFLNIDDNSTNPNSF